jgi:hypothetical protein
LQKTNDKNLERSKEYRKHMKKDSRIIAKSSSKKKKVEPAMIVHVCNPSCLRGRDRRTKNSRLAYKSKERKRRTSQRNEDYLLSPGLFSKKCLKKFLRKKENDTNLKFRSTLRKKNMK